MKRPPRIPLEPHPASTAPARPGRNMHRSVPRQIRIIGGAWKRTPLPVLDLDGLRPTPDRVRETLFNWLGQDMTGQSCLDLFAGSGALGMEAASRGASQVMMVERNVRAIKQLRANQERLDASAVQVIEADALRLAAGLRPESFDVVFLDPPFEGDLLVRSLILCLPLVTAQGALYIESAHSLERLSANEPDDVAARGGRAFPSLEGWHVTRQGRAGAVHYHLLRRGNKE